MREDWTIPPTVSPFFTGRDHVLLRFDVYLPDNVGTQDIISVDASLYGKSGDFLVSLPVPQPVEENPNILGWQNPYQMEFNPSFLSPRSEYMIDLAVQVRGHEASHQSIAFSMH